MSTSVNIPNNYGIATFHWFNTGVGRDFTVTMGYHDLTGLDDPLLSATAMYNAMVGGTKPIVAANMTTFWRFDPVTVLQRLSTGFLAVSSFGAPVTGTAAPGATESPVFSTLVVSKQTANAGRQFRGRCYPPLTITTESQVDQQGNILAAQVTAQQGFWDAFLASPTLANCQPSVLHATPLSGVTPFPTPILKLRVRPVVGIQRRRRARGA